jgi:predicted nucleic acid-binding protein
MNDWLIVDASVIIKAFVEEPGSDLAGLIWQSDAILAAPAHALQHTRWRKSARRCEGSGSGTKSGKSSGVKSRWLCRARLFLSDWTNYSNPPCG